MEFYEKTGKMALGSRLRRLSEQMTEQAAAIYDLYQIDLQPKWFPVFYSLSATEEKSISDIAKEIGHSHPSVSQIVREMVAKKYVKEKKRDVDGRKNFLILSPLGQQVRKKMQQQLDDVTQAVESAMKETHNDLWQAINEWEQLLDQKSLFQRVQEVKKSREKAMIMIVDYKPVYEQVFRKLNVAWISKYFTMEESDYQALDFPTEYIINKGGYIFMALDALIPVGTCALIPMADGGYEMAKMAVSPEAQGMGIGYLLGQACIEKARSLGAPRVYLESNTILKPAINLYHKLGFRKIIGPPSPYARCNIQMELVL